MIKPTVNPNGLLAAMAAHRDAQRIEIGNGEVSFLNPHAAMLAAIEAYLQACNEHPLTVPHEAKTGSKCPTANPYKHSETRIPPCPYCHDTWEEVRDNVRVPCRCMATMD